MEHVYNCDNLDPVNLVVIHRFPEVNTKLDSLMYYITINGDKVYNQSEDTSSFLPNLISTTKISEDVYKSVYSLPLILSDDKLNDQNKSAMGQIIKVHVVFPFDYKTSIIDHIFWSKNSNILE